MSIIFSIASLKLITMTVDSAVTLTFGNKNEYKKGRKAYRFPGVGCVATWGARVGNKVGPFLESKGVESETHSVIELADLVYDYLRCEYQPHKDGLEDVGYHIAGFDRDGRARLFHVFWGFDRPRPPDQTAPGYKRYDHSSNPPGMYITFLYNGRNDLAETVFRTLALQVQAGEDTRYDIQHEIDHALFGDFAARFASEITPEVGPPFYTFLISFENEIAWIKNDTFCPLNRRDIEGALRRLGYRFEGEEKRGREEDK